MMAKYDVPLGRLASDPGGECADWGLISTVAIFDMCVLSSRKLEKAMEDDEDPDCNEDEKVIILEVIE